MRQNPILTTIGVIVLLGLLISFPFFKIKYFDTLPALKLVYRYILSPILIIATICTVLIYYKCLRKFNKKTNSKIKIVMQDVSTITFLAGIFSAILVGLTFSTIVTTNAYLKPQGILVVRKPVIAYEQNRTKWGRLRHYIKFANPMDNSLIHMEVYRNYNVGETFIKEMKIGKWGLLYAMD